MPIYEYACTACGERVEAKQSFDDPPLETCEICGGKLRKLYSPVGVVFKGSGFYATDSKKKGSSSSSNSSSSSSGSKSESKSSSTSSDSKKTSSSSGSDSSSSSSKE
jgi:putative FmdB family regulatory protein